MAQNIHYYSNIQERKYSDEILDQIKNKTQQNNSKFYNSKSDIKELFRSWTPFSFFFLSARHFYLWDWFHTLLPAFMGRYSTSHIISFTFRSPIQSRLCFISSCNGLSWLPCRDTPYSCQNW